MYKQRFESGVHARRASMPLPAARAHSQAHTYIHIGDTSASPPPGCAHDSLVPVHISTLRRNTHLCNMHRNRNTLNVPVWNIPRHRVHAWRAQACKATDGTRVPTSARSNTCARALYAYKCTRCARHAYMYRHKQAHKRPSCGAMVCPPMIVFGDTLGDTRALTNELGT